MQFNLKFTLEAKLTLEELEVSKSKIGVLKQIKKTLGLMEANLKHPSLNTHKFDEINSPLGTVFESYVQNNTLGAYRIFWVYGPGQGNITVIAITPHT